KHLHSAAAIQRIPAKWPTSAPWSGLSSGPANERQKLTDIYSRINEKSASWPNLAHLGLLHFAQGQALEAFKVWRDGLEKLKPNADAEQAAGFMLHAYRTARQWPELEATSRLLLKKNIRAIYRKQVIASRE